MKYSLLKRISAFVLAFALVMTTAFNAVGTTQANAAKKATVSAKGATVTVGASKNIKVSIKCKAKAKATIKVAVVKGATGKVTKKVTNSNAKKAAKTCKSTIKVTGKKAGKVKLSITPYINGKKAGKAKKITVTVKAAETTAAPATTTAADVTTAAQATTTQAPDTTQDIPVASTDASGNPAVDISLSNKTPKVGETLTASVNVPSGITVASYAWYIGGTVSTINEKVSSDASSATSLSVTTSMLGKYIKLVVTDSTGKTYEAVTSAAVTQNTAVELTITDTTGLQTDGTGKVGDTLTLSYGSSLGTPEELTWYRGQAVLGTWTKYGEGINAGLKIDGADTEKPGEYYAVIKNTEGVSHTSNIITLTETDARAIIKSVTIEDDYLTKKNKAIDYAATTDAKMIVTMVLNKCYAGTVTLYRGNDSKYSVPVTTPQALGIKDNVGTGLKFTGLDSDQIASVMNTDLTDADVEGTVSACDIALNGEATYKFVVDGSLERGTSYVAVLDQTNIKDDAIGEGKENASAAFTVPYLRAASSVAISKAPANAELEAKLYGADGKVLDYINSKSADTVSGVTIKFYNNTSNSTNGATEISGTNTVKSGVITSGGLATTTHNSNYVTVEVAPGIMGKEKITLTSDFTPCAPLAATAVKLEQNATTPTSLDVSFENVVAEGTVYIVDDTDIGKFNKENPITYKKTGSVKTTTNKVTIADVISANDAGKSFVAVFVPTDENKNSSIKSAPFTLTLKAKTYKIVGTNSFDGGTVSYDNTANFNGQTGTAIQAYDQFGTAIVDTVIPEKLTTPFALTCENPTVANTPDTATKVTFTGGEDTDTERGYAAITVTAGGAKVNKGEKWSIKLSTGQTLTLEATSNDETAAASATWKATLS